MTSEERNDVFCQPCRNTRFVIHAPGHMDAECLEQQDCGTPSCRRSHGYVEMLLDLSEENSVKDLEASEMPSPTGWDEAIHGWDECPSFSCLFTAQQMIKKHQADVSASHCVLCTDLRLSESSHTASEVSCRTSEEPSGHSLPPSLDHVNRASSAISCSSSSGEPSPKQRSIKNDLLRNKLLFGPEQNRPDKCLPHTPQPGARCHFMRERNARKVALIGRVMVLPPVKVPTNPKSANGLKRRDGSSPGPVTVTEKVDQEKAEVTSHSSPTIGTSQGAVMSKQGPQQHQYHLVSALSSSRKCQIPITSLAESHPGATSVPERHLRQEVRIRSPLRHNSGHRSRLDLKYKTMKRTEPELPMLLGARIQIPVFTRRLL